MIHSTTTDAGKRFRIKGIRKGTTKLESRDILCISMEGEAQIDAHRLLDMLSSIGFRWGSGHELWEHPCHKAILARNDWIFLHTGSWDNSQNSSEYCKEYCKEFIITLDHLEVLIEDFLYEHQS